MRYVNCSKEVCTHYCGRPESYKKAIGKPINFSMLGNPFVMRTESERDDVIRRYAKRLLELCKGDSIFASYLGNLPNDAILGCFCAPKDCHCRIIIEAAEYYRNK